MDDIKGKTDSDLLSIQPLEETSARHLSVASSSVSLGKRNTIVALQENSQDSLVLYPVENAVGSNPLTSSQNPFTSEDALTYLDAGGNFVIRPQVSQADVQFNERDDNPQANSGPQFVVVREGDDGDTMAYIYIQSDADAAENLQEMDVEQAHTITLNSADGSTLHTLPASYTQHLEHAYGDLVLVNGNSGADNDAGEVIDSIVEDTPHNTSEDRVLLLSVQSIKLEEQNNTSEVLSLPPISQPKDRENKVSVDMLDNATAGSRKQRESAIREKRLPDDEMPTIEERLAKRDSLLPKKPRQSKSYVCVICHTIFKSNYKFNIHQSIHKGHNIWHCDVCKYTCDTLADLKHHKNLSHKDARPYNCQLCELRFPKSLMLDNHVRFVHNKERPLSCSFCSKGFYRPHDLKMHLNLHLGIKSNVCYVCGRLFSHPSNLIRHHRLHTGIKPYVCPTCGKRFNQLILLFKHRTIHQPEAGVCPLCPSTFRSAAGLKKHYKFEHKKSMTLQEATHVVQGQGALIGRRYYCQICGEQFLIKTDLKKHEKKEHGNSTLLVCPTCNQTFASEDMESHICFGSIESDKRTISSIRSDNNAFQPRTKFVIKSDLKKYVKREDDERDERLLICSTCNKMFDARELKSHICQATKEGKSQNLKSEVYDDDLKQSKHIKAEEEEYLVMYITPEGESVSYVMKKRGEEGPLDKVLQINAPIGENLMDDSLRSNIPDETIMINVQDRPVLEHAQENTNVSAKSEIDESDHTLVTPSIGHSSSLLNSTGPSAASAESLSFSNIKVEPHCNDNGDISDFQNISQVSDMKNLVPPLPENDISPSSTKTETKPAPSQDSELKHNIKRENEESESPNKCRFCGKKVMKRWNYLQHLATHDASLHRYKCEVCSLTFAYRSTFTNHMRKHSNEQTGQPCPICKKIYKTAMSLSQHHKRSHLRIRPHSCSLCQKEFYSIGDLKYHLRLHNKEQPYICFACGRNFTHVSHLHRHERTHTGERPHKCPFCPKDFIQLVSLKIHLKKHEKEAAAENQMAGNAKTCAEIVDNMESIEQTPTLSHDLNEDQSRIASMRDDVCDATEGNVLPNNIIESLNDPLHGSSGGAAASADPPSIGEFSSGTIILTSGNLEASSDAHFNSEEGVDEDCITIGPYLFKKI